MKICVFCVAFVVLRIEAEKGKSNKTEFSSDFKSLLRTRRDAVSLTREKRSFEEECCGEGCHHEERREQNEAGKSWQLIKANLCELIVREKKSCRCKSGRKWQNCIIWAQSSRYGNCYELLRKTKKLCPKHLIMCEGDGSCVDKKQKCNVDSGSNCCKGKKCEDYRGTKSVTKSGRKCQLWDSQTPHKHNRNIQRYPKAGLVFNHCRNPDGEPWAWCYTTDPKKRWETCDIPKCWTWLLATS